MCQHRDLVARKLDTPNFGHHFNHHHQTLEPSSIPNCSMAGLQQYNFFPTDLFYPKPSSPASKPTVLPLQTPAGGDIITNTEDLHHNQQQQPRSLVKATPSSSSALVHSHKRQQPSVVNNKVPKFSTTTTTPSWMDWIDQEEDGF